MIKRILFFCGIIFVCFKININAESPVYRLYNPNSGEHLFTANYNELTKLNRLGWRYEGNLCNSDGTISFYRLYNPRQHTHVYVKDGNEKNKLIQKGWLLDFYGKPVFYGGEYGIPIWRLYNGKHHHYTADEREIYWLETAGWKREKTVWRTKIPGIHKKTIDGIPMYEYGGMHFEQIDMKLYSKRNKPVYRHKIQIEKHKDFSSHLEYFKNKHKDSIIKISTDTTDSPYYNYFYVLMDEPLDTDNIITAHQIDFRSNELVFTFHSYVMDHPPYSLEELQKMFQPKPTSIYVTEGCYLGIKYRYWEPLIRTGEWRKPVDTNVVRKYDFKSAGFVTY